MYFWQIEKLKQALAERPLSDREALPYLVVYSALYSAAACFPQIMETMWDLAGAIWTVLVAVLGTIYIYRQNGGREGHHFLQRYFAIGWVVSVRWLAIGVVCLVAYAVPVLFLDPETEGTQWHDFLAIATLEVVVCWRIGHHIHDLARKTKPAIPPVVA